MLHKLFQIQRLVKNNPFGLFFLEKYNVRCKSLAIN